MNNNNKVSIPSLDEVLLSALSLFKNEKIKKLDITEFKKPLIAWSWNAIVTAKIVFWNSNAKFCDETNFDESIETDIDWLIIMSASWEKHASIFANKAKKLGIKTKLITCNNNSTTQSIIWVENVICTPKNVEPYTYNTSTYLWWILAITWESASEIESFIKGQVDPIISSFKFSDYDSFLLATPNNLAWVNQLFIVKFIELFWRKVSRDVFTYEQLKHAITVVPHSWELCITFWKWELIFKWNRLNIPLPQNCGIWALMSIWYYLVWKIQNSFPQYFKENITEYIKSMNETEFWKNLKVYVK